MVADVLCCHVSTFDCYCCFENKISFALISYCMWFSMCKDSDCGATSPIRQHLFIWLSRLSESMHSTHFELNTKIWMRKCENCSWHLNSRPSRISMLNKCLFYLMRIDVFYSVHFPAKYLIALNSEMYTVAQLQFAKSHNKPRYFLNYLFTLHKFKFEFSSDALRQLFTFRQFDSSIGRKRNCMREIVCNYPSEIGTLNFMSYAGKR